MKEGKSFEMAIKIYFRRFISVLLCCLLVFCSLPVEVHASDPVTAASLAITGGQLAGAGLSGEAALSLAGPVGAVVGVTLGALGVNAYVSKAAQEAGKTRTRFVLDKLVIWGAQAGYTQEQLYSKIAQGISVASDGTIQLGKDAAQTIQQFGNWLFTQDGEVIEQLPAVESTVALNGLNLPYGTSLSFTGDRTVVNVSTSSAKPLVAYIVQDTTQTTRYRLCVLAQEQTTVHCQFIENSGYSNTWDMPLSGPTNGYYGSNVIAYSGIVHFTPSVPTMLGSSYWQSLPYSLPANGEAWEPTTSGGVDEVFTGTPDAWAENKDVLNPSAEDTPIALNPDLLNPIIDSLTDGQQATMTIIDYLQALQDAWDHALDDVQTAIGTITDSLTGIQEQIAIPQTAVENPSITNPSVTPDTTPILNPSDVNPGTAITGLSFDLTNIFPFCIPFDIYAALNLLDAEPVAPSYHVHLEWPYNIIIDFTIDLSPFNQVAAVARTMETLIFIIGLAVMTRSMFIRG